MTQSLEVSRQEFAEGLRAVTRFTSVKYKGDAILSFQSGFLRLDLNGATSEVPAEGAWEGEARVAGSSLVRLVRSLPPGDPLHLRVDDGRFRIENFSLPCFWQAEQSATIELPIDAPLPVILALPLDHTEKEIDAAGLSNVLLQAKATRNHLIGQAAPVLKPLGVRSSDLLALVDELTRQGRPASNPYAAQGSVSRYFSATIRGEGYFLEMRLENHPVPGRPQNFVIASRRTPSGEPPNYGYTPDAGDWAFGDWAQPVSPFFLEESLSLLRQARILPVERNLTLRMCGPAWYEYAVIFRGSEYRWVGSPPAGWEPLGELVDRMKRSVKQLSATSGDLEQRGT